MVIEDIDLYALLCLQFENAGKFSPGFIISEYIKFKADKLLSLLYGFKDSGEGFSSLP
jgi:hypothetical protein